MNRKQTLDHVRELFWQAQDKAIDELEVSLADRGFSGEDVQRWIEHHRSVVLPAECEQVIAQVERTMDAMIADDPPGSSMSVH